MAQLDRPEVQEVRDLVVKPDFQDSLVEPDLQDFLGLQAFPAQLDLLDQPV